jgi:hypothetical protein
MLRYIGANNEEAHWDLIWSVGGSPPYGGVSTEEAGAVYELIESYRGAGQASSESFEAVRRLIQGRPDALGALDAFECHDTIVSDSENISLAHAQRGREISERLGHDGARASFLILEGQAHLQRGDAFTAKQMFQDALPLYASLAAHDPVYNDRLGAVAQNSISLAANEGDIATARALFEQVGHLVPEPGRSQIGMALQL